MVAVRGHEAGSGQELSESAGPEVPVVGSGRELFRCVSRLRGQGEQVCVVPMTLGRHPDLVADTARTLRALPAGERHGTVLAEPFGTSQHLVAWLRAAAGRIPADSALLLTAPSGDPFDDAELYRLGSLVGRHGGHELVEVAFLGGTPDPGEGVRRCALLGASAVTLLPAAFVPPEIPGDARVPVHRHGPLLSPAALARVLAERVADARRRWTEHGDDGVAAALGYADDHGYAHTHGPGGHDHGHDHVHDHDHGHDHGHGHGSGRNGHEHGHGLAHEHGHPHAHPHQHPPAPHHPPAPGAGQVNRSTS